MLEEEAALRWADGSVGSPMPGSVATVANDAWPAGRPRPCRVFSPCLPDEFAHAAAAAIAREAGRDGVEDEALRFVLRAALFDLQHRGFRVPDGLDPALVEVCEALMEAAGEEGE